MNEKGAPTNVGPVATDSFEQVLEEPFSRLQDMQAKIFIKRIDTIDEQLTILENELIAMNADAERIE
jgi:hypothetical protein